MKIGVFGGSFNPPHNGHVRAAEIFFKSVPLDLLLIVPSKRPVHKQMRGNASNEDRLNMTRLAFSDTACRIEIYEQELKRETPSYSIETVEGLKKRYPNDELFLYVGDDMLLSFETWKEYKRLLSLCTLFVMTRGEKMEALYEKKRELEGEADCNIIISDAPPLTVSSTDVREMIANGSEDALIPRNVKEYINKKGLYR